MSQGTYRKDLYYIQKKVLCPALNYHSTTGIEEMVTKSIFVWLFYRIQFWRFIKRFKNHNVLIERKLYRWLK